MKTKYFVLILFPVFIFLTFLTIPYSFSAEKVTVVEGIIEVLQQIPFMYGAIL